VLVQYMSATFLFFHEFTTQRPSPRGCVQYVVEVS